MEFCSLLNDEELEGVLAHELGHVNNRDILISSVAATIAGAITMLASMGRWAMIFGGFGGRRPRRSRRRRPRRALHADRRSDCREPDSACCLALARISGRRDRRAFHRQSYALASALQKLDTYSRRVPMQASPSTAHLFIIQPLLGMNFGGLFSTHPPIAKRIERLTGRPAEFMQ